MFRGHTQPLVRIAEDTYTISWEWGDPTFVLQMDGVTLVENYRYAFVWTPSSDELAAFSPACHTDATLQAPAVTMQAPALIGDDPTPTADVSRLHSGTNSCAAHTDVADEKLSVGERLRRRLGQQSKSRA